MVTEVTEISSEPSMAATEPKVSLKLLVDSKAQRVLFAEAGKDFVDFLFNIMSLPVGSVVRLLLNKQGMVGSLGILYESIENLSDVYMQPCQHKEPLLNPKVLASGPTTLPQLLPNIESSNDSMVLYRCSSNNSGCRSLVAEDPKAICPQCRSTMNSQVQFVKIEHNTTDSNNSVTPSLVEGGYVKGVVTYMVIDDLTVKPMSTISSLALLNRFSVEDVGALEEKTFNIGMDEALKLLKARCSPRQC